MKLSKIFLILSAALIVFLLGTGIAVYTKQDYKNLTAKTANFVPYPVARVNYEIIKMADLQKNLQVLENYYQKTRSANSQSMPDKNEMQKMVLQKLVEDKVIDQQLRKYKIRISKIDIEEKLRQIVDLAGGKENIVYELKELYDLNLDSFQSQTLIPSLKYDKLRQAYQAGTLEKSGTNTFEEWLELRKNEAKVKIYIQDLA